MIQKPQTQLKQTQIATMPTMNLRRPAVLMRQRTQVNDPQVSEAGGQHQTHYADRITQMAPVQLKTPAFLVGKEGFNVGTFAIPDASRLDARQVTHQVNRRIIGSLPPSNDHHRTISLLSKQNLLAEFPFTALHLQVSQAQPLALDTD